MLDIENPMLTHGAIQRTPLRGVQMLDIENPMLTHGAIQRTPLRDVQIVVRSCLIEVSTTPAKRGAG